MKLACGAAWLVCALAPAWAQAPTGSGSIYTCVDGKGRRLTSDRPIFECIDREQRELGAGGTVVKRHIGPTMTDLERSALDEQRRKDADTRLRADEGLRRDRALVGRFPNQEMHDFERQNALRPVEDTIAAAYQRIGDLEKRRNALGAELEFHRKDPSKTPESLKRQSADNAGMLDAQRRFIDDQNKEKLRIHARFDAELARLRQLWAGPAGPGADAAVKPASASAGH